MSNQGGSSPLTDARKARLHAELTQEDVPCLRAGDIPISLSTTDLLAELVVEEVLNARHVPVHEGRRPSYGCLLVADIRELVDLQILLPQGTGGADELRPLADGRSSLLIRDLRGDVGLAVESVPDELAMVRLTRRVDGIAIQRMLNGVVKVMNGTTISINDSFEWSTRPYARSLIPNLSELIELPDSDGTQLATVADLLDFCVHSLSPRGIGATFALKLAGQASDLLTSISNPGSAPPVTMNACDPLSQKPLAALLAGVDGACLVESDGTLLLAEAMLKASEPAQSLVEAHHGTRHTSAKRFSFDHPDCLLVVVSADGPVTIFSDGTATLSLRAEDDVDGSWRLRLRHGEAVEIKDLDEPVTCERCRKSLRCRAALAPGGETLALDCPVCGQANQKVVSSALEASLRPYKDWTAMVMTLI